MAQKRINKEYIPVLVKLGTSRKIENNSHIWNIEDVVRLDCIDVCPSCRSVRCGINRQVLIEACRARPAASAVRTHAGPLAHEWTAPAAYMCLQSF